jgi:hypothetical protein
MGGWPRRRAAGLARRWDALNGGGGAGAGVVPAAGKATRSACAGGAVLHGATSSCGSEPASACRLAPRAAASGFTSEGRAGVACAAASAGAGGGVGRCQGSAGGVAAARKAPSGLAEGGPDVDEAPGAEGRGGGVREAGGAEGAAASQWAAGMPRGVLRCSTRAPAATPIVWFVWNG